MNSVLPESWAEFCQSKAFMISLKRFAFRAEYSAYKLKELGFTNIEFIDAFDGFEDDVDVALKNIGVEFKPILGKGHKGCSYSHMAIWKKIIDENIPYITIFEDDCIGHLDLAKGLGQKFWDATPKDFDICYFGNMMNPSDSVLDSSDALVVKSPSYVTHAYCITLEGAKKLWNLAKETNNAGIPLKMIDIQLVDWQYENKINYQCWNGRFIQKSYPTFDEGLPWQAFPEIILPQKDTGLFWQNMRLGTTLEQHALQFQVPGYLLGK